MSLFTSIDSFRGKAPNIVPCECGKQLWTISQRVQRRPLDCPECGRYYYYSRSLLNKTTRDLVGRFPNKKAREKRLADYAKSHR